MKFAFTLLLLLIASGRVAVEAYPANYQLTLPELNAEADLIVKVTALSNAPATEERPEPATSWGYGTVNTRFRVVSVLKGDARGEAEITHRHLTTGGSFQQWHDVFGFDFVVGRSYLL